MNLPELSAQVNWGLIIVNGLIDLVQFVLIFWLLWDRGRADRARKNFNLKLADVPTVTIKPAETTTYKQEDLVLTPEMKVDPTAAMTPKPRARKPVAKKPTTSSKTNGAPRRRR